LKLDIEKFAASFDSQFIKNTTLETFETARQYANSYPTLLAEKKNEEFILEQGYASFETIAERIEELLY
ncbi:MAG: DsbA family protein, partial [Flavobacterium sp.]